ncbi:uncharacterized protein LOC108904361 [Anoplophora glabripennis]|uniref:uncharacterized protein LOC108904361 n=1 Tax=Anoplophora glabripennis TaxID=217634 RepID=UPI000873CA55|nr:uncharacterized protein LOC108904361 [Anoplophora glabripennis]
MAILHSAVIFASILVAIVSGFTITNEDPILPIQQILDDNSFLRTFPNNEQEIVKCPEGTHLDKSSYICHFDEASSGKPISPFGVCSSGIGDFSNPESCRTFVSCGPSGDFTVTCSANLLYNEVTKKCDWPTKAGCCEYVEYNSSRLVQNSS